MHEPPTVRLAAGAIVSATAGVVVVAGIAIRVLDHKEYPDVWVGMWWAIQTVTTVGYGDVTPAHWSGRLVAVFVMLQGIAFLAILTAAHLHAVRVRPGDPRHWPLGHAAHFCRGSRGGRE
jgi:voltage-gated potassium channel